MVPPSRSLNRTGSNGPMCLRHSLTVRAISIAHAIFLYYFEELKKYVKKKHAILQYSTVPFPV